MISHDDVCLSVQSRIHSYLYSDMHRPLWIKLRRTENWAKLPITPLPFCCHRLSTSPYQCLEGSHSTFHDIMPDYTYIHISVAMWISNIEPLTYHPSWTYSLHISNYWFFISCISLHTTFMHNPTAHRIAYLVHRSCHVAHNSPFLRATPAMMGSTIAFTTSSAEDTHTATCMAFATCGPSHNTAVNTTLGAWEFPSFLRTCICCSLSQDRVALEERTRKFVD